MPFDERRNELFQNHATVQLDKSRALHSCGTGARRLPAGSEIVGTPLTEFSTSTSTKVLPPARAECRSASKDRTKERHRAARRRKVQWAWPEPFPQIFELLRQWGRLQFARSHIEFIKLRCRVRRRSYNVDGMNHLGIGRAFRPGLIA